MERYAGIDVSLEASHVCVVDAQGKILKEAKVASEPEALIAWFAAHGTPMARIGLEAGPLSQWLFAEMKAAGLAAELIETRHVRAAFKAMPVKTDRKDARGIAQLMRLGWFRPVHCKSLPAQEVRALLTTRKLLQAKRHDVEMSLRGVLRGFGLKVGPTTPPRKHQSGETDVTGRISRIGDHGVRVALYEAANVILTRAVRGSDLKSWALGVAKRAGMRKAKVALARKLAVVLHRMLADGTTFMASTAGPIGECGRLGSTGGRTGFGRARHQLSRSEVPSPGRWIRSGRKPRSSVLYDCASLDWSTGPHPTPSGSGRTPTADRSKTPAAGSRSRGIDTTTPVTEQDVV